MYIRFLGQKATSLMTCLLFLTPAFLFYSSASRCDSAGGKTGILLGRSSLPHFATRKGWTEVPCTRLDKAAPYLPPSLRTRSVPIIPSLQARDLDGADTSERNQRELPKWHPGSARKTAEAPGGSPSPPREGVAVVVAPLPRSFEIPVEPAQELKQKGLSSPAKMPGSQSKIHRGGSNTPEAAAARESEGNCPRYPAGAPRAGGGTRGLKAAGQREARGHCRGQTSHAGGGANFSLAGKAPGCRGAGGARASPSAS